MTHHKCLWGANFKLYFKLYGVQKLFMEISPKLYISFLMMYCTKQGHSKLDNWGGGGLIFIHLGSAQLISFEINCFYGV